MSEWDVMLTRARVPMLVLTFALSCSALSGLDDFQLTSGAGSGSGGGQGGASSTSSGGTGGNVGGSGGAPGAGGEGGEGGMAPACGDPVWGKRLAFAPEFQPGASGTPLPVRLAVDSTGGILVASGFEGPLDLGEGPLAYEDGVDVLVASFAGDGTLRWAKGFAPDGNTDQWAEDVAVDSADNVLFTGFSTSGLDFGGGPTPSQGANAFVAKLNNAGAHVWSRDLPFSHGLSIAVDSAGAAVIAGYFTQSFDLEPGQAINHGGELDAFVAKWDSGGTRQWVRPYGDGPTQRALGVATGPGDAVLVAGEFEGTLDINPNNINTWLASNGGRDGFVLKLDANGDLLWKQQLGGTGNASARAVAVDANGDVVVVGTFDGQFLLVGQTAQADSEDVFVAKFGGADGSVVWQRTFIALETQDSRGVTIGDAGTIYVTGHYLNAPDFGGGPLPTPVPAYRENVLVLVLDAAGGHVFSAGYGTDNHDRGVDVAVTGCSLLVSGTFHYDFTFGEGAEITEAGGGPETFLARYLVPPTTPMP